MPANYFDRQRFLAILKDPAVVETLYQMYLNMGGAKTVTSNLYQINNRVTTIESADYDGDIAALNTSLDALNTEFDEFVDGYEAPDDAVEAQEISTVLLLVELNRLKNRLNQLEDAVGDHDYIPGLI